MVFSKLSEFISSVATYISTSRAFVQSHKSTGLPPFARSLHRVISSPRNTSFRHASSLLDFSAYHQLDIEDRLSSRAVKSPCHSKPLNILQQESGASSFSKERVLPISLGEKKWMRVPHVFLCLLLFACLCFALLFLFTNLSSGPSKFFVVLDCGSTGTRVYVYQASVNREKDDNLPILLKSLPEGFRRKSGLQTGRAYNRVETEPGFDKLVRNISGLRKAIKPLMKWAEKQIPERSHKATSLFVYATAGVRRLPSSDSRWLLDNTWLILNNSPFLCKKEWVKIISGMEEAYYGWIALNYHNGILGSIPEKETYGSLDLGGSSLQVTFESNLHVNEETSLKLSIGPVNHHLNAYSLAGYGLNDAFDRSVAHLLKGLPRADLDNGKVNIKHPCLQSGYEEQYLCSHCESSWVKNGNPPIANKRLKKGEKAGIRVQLIGNPKWDECTALAKVAVNLSEWSVHSPGIDCELQPCALAEDLPRPVGQFYAMSGFYVVYRFFNLTPDAALDDVLEKGREYCEKDWDAARKSVKPQPFIDQYCFRAPYIVLLLREGLHITDSHVTIGSGSITWTLGVALFEAGKAFPFGRNLMLRVKLLPPIILFAIVTGLLFVVVCAFSRVTISSVPKIFRKPYLPLLRQNGATSASMLNIPAPFRFQRWSPINTGDGRVKMPLSPQRSDSGFGFGRGNGDIQLAESSMYSSSSSSVAHSYSSGNLGQMHYQYDHNKPNYFWTPHRSDMRLQSRRSQSREDLISSIAEAAMYRASN